MRAALTALLGEASRRVDTIIEGGRITLIGAVATAEQHSSVETALRQLGGVDEVDNWLDIVPPAGRPAQPTPMVSLVRFCGLDAASIGAAVTQATQRLAAFADDAGLPPPAALLVLYRNWQASTVTLEVGMAVDAAAARLARDEMRSTQLPAGPTLSALPAPGMTGLRACHDLLIERAVRAGRRYAPYCWQRLELGADGRPTSAPAALYLPVRETPRG